MAIDEHDREDLLRDGTTMSLRGEIELADRTVLVGIRGGGQVSLYCGADPVIQFNGSRQLRRIYWQGQRYAAQHGKWKLLRREGRGGRVSFQQQDVDEPTTTQIHNDVNNWVDRIREQAELPSSRWKIAGDEQAFLSQLLQWLRRLPQSISIANTSNLD